MTHKMLTLKSGSCFVMPGADATPASRDFAPATTISLAVTTLVLAGLAFATSAAATEGGLGRVVQGTNVQPKAGIVADVPILALNISSIYFDGSIRGSTGIPVAGDLALDVSAELSLTPITLLKVWDTGPGRWNFASAVTVPIIWNEVTATLSVGGINREVSQSDSGIFDLLFTPIIAGYHFSPTSHMALSLGIWAPTGSFTKGRLANSGLNYWTVAPTIAYTKLVPDQGFEFTAQGGVQFNSRNIDTDYKSAPLLTADVLMQKALGGGFAVGGNLSWVTQLGDDDGALADRLDGFVGNSLAIGPMIGWSGVWGRRPVEATFRWMPTVASANRLSGDTLMFTFSIPLVLPSAPQ
ncbi:MAG: SphA family protein [Polymorphobacter sp.]